MGLFKKFGRNSESADKTSKPGRLMAGLLKTRAILTADIGDLLSGRTAIDAEVLEELETRLLMADVGIASTETTLDALRKKIAIDQINTVEALLAELAAVLKSQLRSTVAATYKDTDENSGQKPHTILVVGVNGSGKTTTIGKLARYYQQAGASVMLAAGDTFRAAAVEQLQTWGQRNAVPVIAQPSGADSAAVIFDALQAARAKEVDVLLADTAGRLHTDIGLMDELKKIKRVLNRQDAEVPQEILLVLDAGIGQNALQQARLFHEAIGVTGLVLTKLDGTAKGGIVFAIQEQLQLPVQYVGVGEGIDDLQPFDADEFVHAMLSVDS